MTVCHQTMVGIHRLGTLKSGNIFIVIVMLKNYYRWQYTNHKLYNDIGLCCCDPGCLPLSMPVIAHCISDTSVTLGHESE